MGDLEEAIRMAREAVEATPKDHPDRAGRLNHLGIRLHERYKHTGVVDDLEEGIRVTQEAVEISHNDDLHRVCRLYTLGAQLCDRYERFGAIDDLEEAIHIAREVVKATPESHSNRATPLNSLAVRLWNRYLRTGAIDDIDEAIRLNREAANATPKNHPDRATRMNNLGVQLSDRYSRTGLMGDLEEAIRITREAVEATPKDDPDRVVWLKNLGAELGCRYLRTWTIDDLEEAIALALEVVEATPKDHPDRAGRLNNLGIRLGDRHGHTRAMDDLDEAIRILREAVDSTPKDRPDRAGFLYNLGVRLGDRYTHTRAIGDLEEAIRIAREAVEATPKDHPYQTKRLVNLGRRLRDRYSFTEAMDDLEEAKQCFDAALNNRESSTNDRIKAGLVLLPTIDIQDTHRAYLVAKATIELVPLLTPLSLQNTDKQYLLSQVVGLASNTAAVALLAGKGPVPAIKFLEMGRGVLASSLQDLRTDLSALKQQGYEALAHSFSVLRDHLDTPTLERTLETSKISPGVSSHVGADRRQESGKQMQILLAEIRSKPGFGGFLLPASEVEMREAATRGPIVVLNVSSHRCDALIVEQSGVKVLELRQLSHQGILNRTQDVQSLETLSWLWDAVVNPVLHTLGFNRPPSGDALPRVWWIPTGPLVGFPLHAAGHHFERGSDTALDRVVSSYSSSIKALIHSRQHPRQETAVESPNNLVLVTMKDTPEQKSLQYANDETSAVQTACESMGLPCVRPPPYNKDVSSALRACKVFHFAGHGYTDQRTPLQSHLLLQDWKSEPLTVSNLLETNLGSTSPFLAYLSACGTGQIRDKKSIDESIHLTSAFQLAGFRHVIGTLWEVDDELCVSMARLTYKFLRVNGISDESVSGALHQATKKLRDDWVHQGDIQDSRPARSIEKCEGSRLSRPLWVPYVHYGV